MNNKFILIAAILLGFYVFFFPTDYPTQFGAICLIIAGCSLCIVTELEEILKVLRGEQGNEPKQTDTTIVQKGKETVSSKKQEEEKK